ncbi:VanZ family protein [Kistimonas asteriae]|uniref:VanZ family protein n=1 Tax=Kistimonas asteriae TaxID=517724 RepID=UPI001BAB4D19|nr:VanZ family protein [Kistimonas asteriae]
MALSLMPNAYDPILSVWDKAKHFAAFFLLMALFHKAWPNRPTFLKKCLLLVLYGLLVESLQTLTPDRHFSLLDLLANTTGIAAFACAMRMKALISEKLSNGKKQNKVQVNPPVPNKESITDMETAEQERYHP